MSRPLRIAFLLGSFPVISETFILRQITGLLDLGHDVRIFANARPEASAPVHPEVAKYDLLNRATYIDGPAESIFWELPVWPLTHRTWSPGAASYIAN
jgi:colanic acid/amylovoran biosynthesis glycosyltransferase